MANTEWRVFDNGGETADRYTVCLERLSARDQAAMVGVGSWTTENLKRAWHALALSKHPGHPQGVSQCALCVLPNERIGKEIAFEDLPENVQEHVLMRMREG